MVQIEGKYKLEKNDNLDTYLKGLGVNEDLVTKACAVKPVLTVSIANNKYTIESDTGVSKSSTIFTPGEEFDDAMPATGQVLKSVARVEGNQIVITTKEAGKEGERIYDFTDEGLTITLTVKGTPLKAVRTYKRI